MCHVYLWPLQRPLKPAMSDLEAKTVTHILPICIDGCTFYSMCLDILDTPIWTFLKILSMMIASRRQIYIRHITTIFTAAPKHPYTHGETSLASSAHCIVARGR